MLTRNGWACDPLIYPDPLRAALIGERPLLDGIGQSTARWREFTYQRRMPNTHFGVWRFARRNRASMLRPRCRALISGGQCTDGCRGTRFDPELLENMLKVLLNGARADRQQLSYLAVGLACGHKS
jgi:hypothetical protein